MTIKNGDKTSPDQPGKRVNAFGRIEFVRSGIVLFLAAELAASLADETILLKPPISTTLRIAIIMSISQSWNRSTTSAHVSWKRLSFSNFLKTVPFTSTNWFDSNKVTRAFE